MLLTTILMLKQTLIMSEACFVCVSFVSHLNRKLDDYCMVHIFFNANLHISSIIFVGSVLIPTAHTPRQGISIVAFVSQNTARTL